MARRRKNSSDNWMPPRVRRGRSAYEFRAKDGRTIRLCDASLTPAQVWSTYELFITEQKDKATFKKLVEGFFVSGDFCELAKETQKDYKKYAQKVLAVFGEIEPDDIMPEHIRKYMDKRGAKSRVQANREKTFMSRVFRWGYERGKVKINPCKGVKQFKETARTRYITDKEYSALYQCAPDIVKAAMELAYLCCARQADILELKKGNLLDQGILIKQGKTGVAQVKAWSDRLSAAIKISESLPLKPGMSSIYVIHQPSGSRFTRDAFNARWMKAKKEAEESHPDLGFDFTFHDLKAKGISDLDGNLYEKQAISGHKNITQTARYDRKIAVVPVVGGQNMVKEYGEDMVKK
ncbi:tyrosine-type recombinase/integrase [Dickeya fangzhongdai]|uniref:tyrosine-type recombinase/integrase n=1 Tax=Dickeya fangzhongdai TaxID=1778540 RepID=UPI002B25A0AF|nr:tyrosine-type recombinase/integrase [Dickeya fangzhongdai]WOX99932.1 tyrosine-type recombinase/integrase [Dickeya fangzhongdai]WOY04919.1 tyrosine-type recombinase/integrase [Dickeya fangzhongdai]